MIEQIMVTIIVIAAAGFTVCNIRRKIKGAPDGCGCSGCSTRTSCSSGNSSDCTDSKQILETGMKMW